MAQVTLVIMAAGVGSRFGGGIKQLEPVGPSGEIIMDYSIYDAKQAGFDKVVFIIRKDIEADFKEVIGERIASQIEVAYAYQSVEDIPEQFGDTFAKRTKPWGTGQAVLCAKDVVDGPFLVINADDYYGKEAYAKAYAYLTADHAKDGEMDPQDGQEICMVGFQLKNTLSENGCVTRGVCEVDEEQYLTFIEETSGIRWASDAKEAAVIDTALGQEAIDCEAAVSMNMWGLTPQFMEVLEDGFTSFLSYLHALQEEAQSLGAVALQPDPLKTEYLLPTIIGGLLSENKLSVKVLTSADTWYGVTYKEDKESVVQGIRAYITQGLYPEHLWD